MFISIGVCPLIRQPGDRRAEIILWGLASIPFIALSTWFWNRGASLQADDHALYLLHAQALVDGRPYGDTGIIYTSLNIALSFQPPGLPLVMAAVMKIGGGFHLGAIKLAMTLMAFPFVLLPGLYFSRTHGRAMGLAVMLVLTVGQAVAAPQPLTNLGFASLVWAVIILLDAPGKRLAVLSEPTKSDKEKKVEWSKIPKELKGAARKEFVQKNDGYVSTLTIYEVPSGKELAKHDLWYSSRKNSTELILTDGAVYSINYDNACAKIDDKGEVTVFEIETGYNYGIGVSDDRTVFLAGGLRDAAYVTVDGLKSVKLKLDPIPGWPEYFERFTFTADGTGYGVTSAFRLIKISKEGKVEKTVPVY